MSTRLLVLDDIADTVQATSSYGRPPLKYELVASRARSEQSLIIGGQLTITTGCTGSTGPYVTIVDAGDGRLLSQVAVVAVQNDLSRPELSVIVLPGVMYSYLFDVGSNVTVTILAVVQEHIDNAALVNLKSKLHGQVAVKIPAESVGVSNVIITAWPLSEN